MAQQAIRRPTPAGQARDEDVGVQNDSNDISDDIDRGVRRRSQNVTLAKRSAAAASQGHETRQLAHAGAQSGLARQGDLKGSVPAPWPLLRP
jgi:hypothetical protein